MKQLARTGSGEVMSMKAVRVFIASGMLLASLFFFASVGAAMRAHEGIDACRLDGNGALTDSAFQLNAPDHHENIVLSHGISNYINPRIYNKPDATNPLALLNNNTLVSYRFTAQKDFQLTTLWVFLMTNVTGWGIPPLDIYASIALDNNGTPQLPPLQTKKITAPQAGTFGWRGTASFNVTLKKGEVYHVVLQDDNVPKKAFVIPRTMRTLKRIPYQARNRRDENRNFPDRSLAALSSTDNGLTWTSHADTDYPVFILEDPAGHQIGQPYSRVNPKNIYGPELVGELFTVHGIKPITVRTVGMPVFATNGTPHDDLYISLYDGSALQQPVSYFTVKLAEKEDIGSLPGWLAAQVPATVLLPGKAYRLALSSPLSTKSHAYTIENIFGTEIPPLNPNDNPNYGGNLSTTTESHNGGMTWNESWINREVPFFLHSGKMRLHHGSLET